MLFSLVEVDVNSQVPLHTHPHEQGGIIIEGELEMGIGGHTEPLGPWHDPQKGIAWGRSLVPENLTGKGRYTREMERIMQVSANIADLYSGYRGGNLPITGSEKLTCGGGAGRLNGGRHVQFAPETRLTNLFQTLLGKLDVPVEQIGDSTGTLAQLTDV